MPSSEKHRPARAGKHPAGTETVPAAEPGAVGFPPGSRADRWSHFILRLAVLVLASLWIYGPSSHGDWLWDDDQAITANPTLMQPYSFYRTWVAPIQHAVRGSLHRFGQLPDAALEAGRAELHGADYFPLTATATWLQAQFFGPNPAGYHAVNILLHIAGALLFWRLLSEMKVPGAWLGGLLFAIHPVCVESVAWMSELKNTLSMPLLLLSAIAYVRADDAAEDAPESRGYLLLSVLFFLLSMLAKTSVVMFPVALLLYAWWKRGRISARDVLRTSPYFLISLLLGLMTIFFQHDRAIATERIIVADLITPDGMPSIRGLLSRIATAGMAILFYLWKTVWPFDLLPIYPRWEVDPPKLWQFLPWPVLIAAGWWIWKQRGPAARPNWARHLLFALGFFLLMLLPILGFITISYMRITWVADHFLYLPMISLLGLGAAGIACWCSRAPEPERTTALVTGAILLAVLGYSSFRYSHAWANEDALWTHTLERNPDAWQAHNRLGAKKFSRGHIDDIAPANSILARGAHYHFINSTRLRPDLGETHNNLGTTYSARAQAAGQRGDDATAKRELSLAIAEFETAIAKTPNSPLIEMNLANALATAGRFQEAADLFRMLVEKVPRHPVLWHNYGRSLLALGKKEPAIEAFRKALSIDPNFKDAKEGLALATGEKPAATPPAKPPVQPPSPAPSGSPSGATTAP